MADITDKLAKLGEMTPGQIADFFEREGIKGTIDAPFACPVSRYLSEPGAYVSVTPDDVEDDAGKTIVLPDSVSRFVLAFDEGDYPTLVSD